MTSALAVVLTAAVTLTAGGRDKPLVRAGGDPSRGLLVNRSTGSRPFDPPDPSRPTLVFVHGFNPLPRVVHFEMAEQVAESLARRGGTAFNVLGWDWNAATFDSVRPAANSDAAIRQGLDMALALWTAGVDPSTTHLVGHSAGGIVAASAAHTLSRRFGRPAAQLTLLDPATFYHSVIFQRLEAGSLCPIVENYWAPGPSAYGREVALPGIFNYRVDGPASYAGVLCPLRSDHLFIVRWYLSTMEHPGTSYGYNTTVSSMSSMTRSRTLGDTAGPTKHVGHP